MNRVMVITLGVFLLGTGLVFAQQVPDKAVVQPVEVGNKTCPVSHEKVGKMGPMVKYKYHGKIYNLCCHMCPHTFSSNPSKYAKIAQDDAAKNGKYKGK